MSLRRYLPFVFVLTLVILGVSCNDDWLKSEYDTTIQWEGALQAPLIYGNLNLSDLLESFDSTGYISEDSTGLLYGAYSIDTILGAPDLLQLPDQDFIQFFFRVDSVIPGWALGPPGTVYTQTQQAGFAMQRWGDERLDSVHTKAGTMEIYVRSTIEHMGTLTLSSDQVIIGGGTFREVIEVSSATGDFEETVSLDMSGATIILDNSVPDSTSLFIDAKFDLRNSGADILPSQEVQIINSFRNLEFSGAYGYIGEYDSLIIDKAELELGLLEGNFEGRIKLANPKLNIRTSNNMGVPFAITLLDLEAHFKDGSGEPISIDPSANPIRISAPLISEAGQTVKDSTFIDNTNSDIHKAATSDLTGFQYSVRAAANPDGPRDNFLLDNSELAINVEAVIPLDLRMEDVVLGDTFNFELGGDDESSLQTEDIESVVIRLETDNFMPLDLGVQVYFVDTTQTWLVLDSLFGADKQIFESGELDANGRVINPTSKSTDVTLTRTQIDNLVDANKMLFKAYVETTDGGTKDVKFYKNYSLDFKLGGRIELKYLLESEGDN